MSLTLLLPKSTGSLLRNAQLPSELTSLLWICFFQPGDPSLVPSFGILDILGIQDSKRNINQRKKGHFWERPMYVFQTLRGDSWYERNPFSKTELAMGVGVYFTSFLAPSHQCLEISFMKLDFTHIETQCNLPFGDYVCYVPCNSLMNA